MGIENLTNDEIKEITKELFENLGDIKIKLGRIGKFDPEAVFEAYNAIVEAVKMVENYSDTIKFLSSDDKKLIASELINEVLDIPWIPEFVEGALIGWSIDLVVDVFNKVGGNEWLKSLFGIGINEDEVINPS